MNETFTTYLKPLLLLVGLTLGYHQAQAQSAPTAFGATICQGDSAFVYVQPQAGFTYNWYDAMSGGNLLGTGDTLFLGAPSTTTTYYVEGVSAGGSTNGVGAPDNSIAGGTNYSAFGDGLVFTVQNDTVQLDTVFVYPNGPGNVVINLRTTSNTLLQTATVATTNSISTKTAIPVEFCIPPGTYRLNAIGTTTGGMFRNTGGAAYPYNSPNINIIGAINTSTTFYYFFYDWKYRVGCGSTGTTTPRSSATVTVNPNPVVSLGPDLTRCPDQTIIAQLSGGGTYLWSDGSTSPSLPIDTAGTYWVQCTDSFGCVGGDTLLVTDVVVTSPGLPSDTIFCGDPLQICVANPSGSSYVWNDGSNTPCITITQAGVYIVTCTDQFGCSVSDTVNANLNPPPNATFMADTLACPVIDFFVLAAVGNDNYSWSFGDGGMDTLPNPTYTYANNGNYTVTLITTGPCGMDTNSQQLDINCIVGVEGGLPAGYVIYPNPSAGAFFLRYPVGAESVAVQIYDQRGSLVLERTTEGQLGQLKIEAPLSKGLYFLTIVRDGKRFGQQILVE